MLKNVIELYYEALNKTIEANAKRDFFAKELTDMAKIIAERNYPVLNKKKINYCFVKCDAEILCPYTYVDLLQPIGEDDDYKSITLYLTYKPCVEFNGEEQTFLVRLPLKSFLSDLESKRINFSSYLK